MAGFADTKNGFDPIKDVPDTGEGVDIEQLLREALGQDETPAGNWDWETVGAEMPYADEAAQAAVTGIPASNLPGHGDQAAPPTTPQGDSAGAFSGAGNGAPGAAPGQSDSDTFTYNGRTLTRAEAEGLLSFYDELKTNPNLAAGLNGVLTGQYTFAPVEYPGYQTPVQPQQIPTPTPTYTPNPNPGPETQPQYQSAPIAPTIPNPDIDAVKTVLADMYRRQQMQEQQNIISQQHQLAETYARTVKNVQTKFQLSDEQMTTLTNLTARQNLVPALAQQHRDPIRGTVDNETVISKALEMALWSDPDLRKTQMERQANELLTTVSKQKKQSGLHGNNGGSGSTGRQLSDPSTSTPTRGMAQGDKIAAMAAVIDRALKDQPE